MSTSSIISFTILPLFTFQEDKFASTLIKLDELNLLFDCGWNEQFHIEAYKKYKEKLEKVKIDAVFISSNSINYFGALSVILSFPLNSETKVYATTPIAKLGIYEMLDCYININESLECNLEEMGITMESISDAFACINDIKFKEKIELRNEQMNSTLTISAIPSGFTLGGSVWKFVYRYTSFSYLSTFSLLRHMLADAFVPAEVGRVDFLVFEGGGDYLSPLFRLIKHNDFSRRLLDAMEEGKTVFVPGGGVNLTLEFLLRLSFLVSKFEADEKQLKFLQGNYIIKNSINSNNMENSNTINNIENINNNNIQNNISNNISNNIQNNIQNITNIKNIQSNNIPVFLPNIVFNNNNNINININNDNNVNDNNSININNIYNNNIYSNNIYKNTNFEKYKYRIIACSECSRELVDAIKSLTEFLGSKAMEDGGELASFKLVDCVSSLEDLSKLKEKICTENKDTKVKFFIVAGGKNLNFGLSHSLLPSVLCDRNCLFASVDGNVEDDKEMQNIINCVYSFSSSFPFEEKRKVPLDFFFEERKIEGRKNEENENEEEKKETDNNININNNNNNNINNINNNNTSNTSNIYCQEPEKFSENFSLEERPLFEEKNKFLVFDFEEKKKNDDYGLVLPYCELLHLKGADEDEKKEGNSWSKFEEFKKRGGKKRGYIRGNYRLPKKIKVETKKLQIECEFLFFDLISRIDQKGKIRVLEEINPTIKSICIGELYNNNNNMNSPVFSNMINISKSKPLDIKIDCKSIEYSIEQATVNSLRQVVPGVLRLNKEFIGVKRLRSEEEKEDNPKEYKNNKYIYYRGDFNLLSLKRKLEKDLEMKMFIYDGCIKSENGTLNIKLDKKEKKIELNCTFSDDYFKLLNSLGDICN